MPVAVPVGVRLHRKGGPKLTELAGQLKPSSPGGCPSGISSYVPTAPTPAWPVPASPHDRGLPHAERRRPLRPAPGAHRQKGASPATRRTKVEFQDEIELVFGELLSGAVESRASTVHEYLYRAKVAKDIVRGSLHLGAVDDVKVNNAGIAASDSITLPLCVAPSSLMSATTTLAPA